jgi:heme exporter protein D
MRHAIQLDFAGGRPTLSLAGGLLLAVGVVAASVVFLEYHTVAQHRAGLELKLAALARADALAAAPDETPADARILVSAEQAATDLATPWTLLLSELEQASKEAQGQVAVLGVEPDHGKHNVRVSAEARTLSLALAYVERLQASRSLSYPMLDRHEIRADDAQHPVRFELSGAWRDLP